MPPSHLTWAADLERAAEQFDGGARSFPLSREDEFPVYEAPNEDYHKLFWRQMTASKSRQGDLFHPHSAGWLMPDEDSVCKPVFVAHSMSAAIWLMMMTLGVDTLPDC